MINQDESRFETKRTSFSNYFRHNHISVVCLSLLMFYRSNHWRYSLTKGIIINLVKFTGKQLWQSLFFNMVTRLSQQLYYKKTLA